jgi:hypothetical protein
MRILIKWYSEIIITKAQIFFPITVLLKAMEIVHTLHTLVQDAIWVSLTTLSLFHHLYIIDFNVTSTGSCHKLSVTKKLVGKASHNWKEIALDSFPHCTKVYSNGINVMKWAVSRSVCLWSPEMALHWGERFGSLFILIAVQNFTGINIHHYIWRINYRIVSSDSVAINIFVPSCSACVQEFLHGLSQSKVLAQREWDPLTLKDKVSIACFIPKNGEIGKQTLNVC